MASKPIVTVNLWYDAPVMDEPFIGLPGRVTQWVFDKSLVLRPIHQARTPRLASLARVERRRHDRRRTTTRR